MEKQIEKDILAEDSPVQMKLCQMEIYNPSPTRLEDIKDEIDHKHYEFQSHNQKIGVDFLTNQPKYKLRISSRVKEQPGDKKEYFYPRRTMFGM
jgi:hypothetical protein